MFLGVKLQDLCAHCHYQHALIRVRDDTQYPEATAQEAGDDPRSTSSNLLSSSALFSIVLQYLRAPAKIFAHLSSLMLLIWVAHHLVRAHQFAKVKPRISPSESSFKSLRSRLTGGLPLVHLRMAHSSCSRSIQLAEEDLLIYKEYDSPR